MDAVERVFCEHLLPVYQRQMRFFAGLGSGRYEFETATGTLRFPGGATYQTQILGMETPAGEWQWAWADEKTLQPSVMEVARELRAWGQAKEIEAFTSPQLSVASLCCQGHTLAAVGSAVKGVHPYFRCDNDGFGVYVLVTEERYESELHSLAQSAVWKLIQDMFAAFAQPDDMLTLDCALKAAGFETEHTETTVVARRGTVEPMVIQKAWFEGS
ncbi:MAG: DUF6882 domain-containing protein [Myxococcota bacterium]